MNDVFFIYLFNIWTLYPWIVQGLKGILAFKLLQIYRFITDIKVIESNNMLHIRHMSG